MIKKIVLILCFLGTLTSCERIESVLADKLDENLNTTLEQDNISIELYEALLKEDEPSVLMIVDPKIREETSNNIHSIFGLLSNIKNFEAVDPVIIGIKKSISTEYGKVLEVSYLYKYSESDVQMTVLFKGHDGGTSVVGFWIKSKVMQNSFDDTDVASPAF